MTCIWKLFRHHKAGCPWSSIDKRMLCNRPYLYVKGLTLLLELKLGDKSWHRRDIR
mgnify:FL=1